jgi:hypothetical protein
MIANAIGTPKPSALKITATNSVSRLACCLAPDDVMTCSLEPREPMPAPKDERSIAPSDQMSVTILIGAMLGLYG